MPYNNVTLRIYKEEYTKPLYDGCTLRMIPNDAPCELFIVFHNETGKRNSSKFAENVVKLIPYGYVHKMHISYNQPRKTGCTVKTAKQQIVKFRKESV
jgi:hypothetical protein